MMNIRKKKWELERRYHLLAVLLIVIVAVIIFANTFRNDFLHDDLELIVKNYKIRDWGRIGELLREERPVRELSFMVDYHLWRLNRFGYHLTNLILHIACSVLLYLFLNTAFKNVGVAFMRPSGLNRTPALEVGNPGTGFKGSLVSLVAALLFAAHPIHTEAVTGIANRQEPLVMLFFILSFIAYIKKDEPSGQRYRGLVLYGCSIVCYVLALLSKQVALALPVMLVLYDLYFRRELVRKNIWFWVPYFAIPLIGLFLTRATIASLVHPAYLRLSYSQMVLTTLRGLVKYMKLVLLPYNLCADYSFPISAYLAEGSVIVPIAILLASFCFVGWTYRLSKEISFGLAWFFVSLLPVSNFIPSTPIVAERYLYVPSVGFCLIVALLMVWLMLRAKWSGVGISLLSIILLSYSTLTILRNSDWRSAKTLWEKTVRQNPLSGVAHNQLGILYYGEGSDGLAIQEYKKALEVSPQWALPHNNLAVVYLKQSWLDEAMSESKKALEVSPGYAAAHSVLGAVYAKMGRYQEAIVELEKAVKIDPSLTDARHNLGSVYVREGLYAEAISQYEKVLEMEPNYPGAKENLSALRGVISDPDTTGVRERISAVFLNRATRHYNQANLYRDQGLYDQAISEYEKALELCPDHRAARYELAALWLKKQLYDRAISEFKRALETSGGNAQIHNGLGVAYQSKGEHELAALEYKKALEFDPQNLKAHSNLGALYQAEGDYDKAISEYRRAIEIDPDYTKSHNNLGVAYYEKKMYDEAILQFERVLELDSTYCDAYYNLAWVYEKKGEPDKVQYYLGLQRDCNQKKAKRPQSVKE